MTKSETGCTFGSVSRSASRTFVTVMVFKFLRMRDLRQVFNGEPDNADADSLDREDRIRPHLLYACHVRRKDRKSRFLQPAPQLRQAVVEFMIAESSGTVSQTIHDVDHGLSEEFIADHRSREHVAAIEKHVRLFAADHCSEMRQPTDFAAGQHLTVHVIRVEDDEVRRGLGKDKSRRKEQCQQSQAGKPSKHLPRLSQRAGKKIEGNRGKLPVMSGSDMPLPEAHVLSCE